MAIETIEDFEARRKTKLHNNKYGNLTWACACGSRRFKVVSSKANVKLVCPKCGHSDIIVWYHSANDSSAGHIKNLNTQTWER